MKFEYEDKSDNGECIAYLKYCGLVVGDNEDSFIIFNDGSGVSENYDWNPSEGHKKFYPGDKITITF